MSSFGKMLRWPKVELTGIATLSALSLNRQAVCDVLSVWAAHSNKEAKSPPVHWLKQEVLKLPNEHFLVLPFLQLLWC